MNDLEGVVRAIYEEGWSHGDFSSLAGAFADVVLHHSGDRSQETDLDDLMRVVARWRAAFPDLEFRVHQVVAAGEVVAVRATLLGTQCGTWLGIEPTGRSIEVPHAFFHRFADGVLVEVWELLDRDLLLRQMTG